MVKIMYLGILFSRIVFSSELYQIDHSYPNDDYCPAYFKIVFPTDTSSVFKATFIQKGQPNEVTNNFDLTAPIGLIKGLAYPFGVYTRYRNFQDENGFYFQRKGCERIGLFEKCHDWVNMQSFLFPQKDVLIFKLNDLFYRLEDNRYPVHVGLLPIAKSCHYLK